MLTNAAPTILSVETDSAWMVILGVSLITFVAAMLLRRLIGRPGGLASGILLTLPLIVPLLAAIVFETAALPEVGILQPAGRALTRGSGLFHLLLVTDPDSGLTIPYALTGTAGSWLVVIGLAVTSFMLVRRGVGMIMVRTLIRRCAPLPAELARDLIPIVARLSDVAGLKTVPNVLLLPAGYEGAFAVGGRRGRILISERLPAILERPELEATLAHEIAHLEAKDTQLLFAAGLLRDIVAWNPIAHLSYRRLVADREFEADRRAAQVTGEPLTVASGILKVCEALRGTKRRSRPVVAFLRPGSQVSRRVTRLLALADGNVQARPGHLPYLAAAALLIVLGLQAGARIAGSDSRALAITWGTSAGAPSDAYDFKDLYRDLKARQQSGPAKKGSDGVRPAHYAELAGGAVVRSKDVDKWFRAMNAWTELRPKVRLRWESRQNWRAYPMFSELKGPFGIYKLERQPL